MKIEIKNSKLSITDIDVSDVAVKKAPLSKKGQNPLLATTGGFMAVTGGPDGLKVALNVICKRE